MTIRNKPEPSICTLKWKNNTQRYFKHYPVLSFGIWDGLPQFVLKSPTLSIIFWLFFKYKHLYWKVRLGKQNGQIRTLQHMCCLWPVMSKNHDLSIGMASKSINVVAFRVEGVKRCKWIDHGLVLTSMRAWWSMIVVLILVEFYILKSLAILLDTVCEAAT